MEIRVRATDGTSWKTVVEVRTEPDGEWAELPSMLDLQSISLNCVATGGWHGSLTLNATPEVAVLDHVHLRWWECPSCRQYHSGVPTKEPCPGCGSELEQRILEAAVVDAAPAAE